MADPFEEKINTLLQERRKVAERIVKAQQRREGGEVIEEDMRDDRLPFHISKTVQYLKADEYARNKKALKKLTDM